MSLCARRKNDRGNTEVNFRTRDLSVYKYVYVDRVVNIFGRKEEGVEKKRIHGERVSVGGLCEKH